ncbi:MAG: MBL fold metallo-hydrolase [Candidatus Omnitrophota bacterium]
MIEQLRASGGIWLSSGSENIILDPGPGSLVRATSSRPRLDPTKLTAVVLSHKHLDHSNDVNVMIEAMTSGGHKRQGAVFVPQDALSGPDPIIFHYLRSFPARVEALTEGKEYSVGEITFTPVKKMLHPVETYGFNFNLEGKKISFITDTGYFPGIEDSFSGEMVVVNVVLAQPKPEIFHLSLPEAETILAKIKPKKAILTHFGRTALALKPWEAAAEMSRRLGIEVIAAGDGLKIEIS